MIRLLGDADLDAFLHLRREAVASEPFSFAASPEDDHASSPAFVREALGAPGRAIVGAFDAGLVGVAGIYRHERRKEAHKATIWGVYVAPAARGRGLGAALVSAAVAVARTWDGVRQVHLIVSARTPNAARVYERLGFVRWGTEPAGLCVDGVDVPDHHMLLDLREAAG